MKQILQSLKTGATEVADVPCPGVSPGGLLINTSRSLISAGTERMLIEFGRANLFEKARQQPDRVRTALDKVKTDGLASTLGSVRHKLGQPIPLGYCNVGVVAEAGSGVSRLVPGDRVASNGSHAEIVDVAETLCARVPDGVSDDHAAFTVLGAIALQGIRLARPTLGEAVTVTGLGLIGLLAVQLLRAHGCRVLGIDLHPERLALAQRFGAEIVDLAAGQDPIASAEVFSRGRGIDAVLVTATTQSSEPIRQAALMSRQRGRIVLVGVAGLQLSRDDFYKKELTLQVSASYGAGRYDRNYEEKGQDYPVGFVRWTAQRNFEAVLDMMAEGHLDITPLISHRFAIEDAGQAYDLVSGTEPSLGILLEYPGIVEGLAGRSVRLSASTSSPVAGTVQQLPAVSVIGAGNYATGVLIPAFKASGVPLRFVASAGGVTGVHAGRKFGFAETTTEVDRVFADRDTDIVVIATRHDSHATLVLRALAAKKHVFVEKPLCLTLTELAKIEAAYHESAKSPSSPRLMVGFNRRFAPHVQRIKSLLSSVAGPRSFVMTVNAGALPIDHWAHDPLVGGGRLLGEGCHFIDLLRFLAGVSIKEYQVAQTRTAADTATIQMTFEDGSIGTVHYFANGSRRFPKERLEVFVSGCVLQLDNFRKLIGFGWPGFRSMKLWRQDKGHDACAQAFVESVRTGAPAPIPFDEIVEVSRVAIGVSTGFRRGPP